MDLKDTNNASNYLTLQEYKKKTQDLKQKQVNEAEPPQLATIEPLYWDYYIRLIYYMIKAAGFTKLAAHFYLSHPVMLLRYRNRRCR